MTITLQRLAAGRYVYNDWRTTVALEMIETKYYVEKFASGWRWSSSRDASVGGEWRATKAEATLDLIAFLEAK
jgi:hypothetical protein